MANVAARQRAASGAGDVLHIEIAQTGGVGLGGQGFHPGDGLRRPPETAASEVDGLETGALFGQADRAGDAAAGGRAADDVQLAGGGTGRWRGGGEEKQEER